MIPHRYSTKQHNEEYFDDYHDKSKRIKWYDQVLLNRPAKVVLTLLLIAVVGPLLIYRFVFFASLDLPPADGFSVGTCFFPRDARMPCGNRNTTECHPQCCLDRVTNFCFHRLPSRFAYITDRAWSEDSILQPRISTVPYAFQRSKTNLKLSIDERSPTHLTLTYYESSDSSLTGRRNENRTYDYEVTSPELNVVISSAQGTIFNTARGPLIASENIWEITFQLTNESMYGFGELPLKPGTTKVLYNHDGGLSSIPLIFAKLNGNFHGLLIDGTSPTEVSVQTNNHIVVRSITNTGLKLHIFVGPKPRDVMEDAMKLMGTKMLLEYWMLGAHICSEVTATLSDGLQNLRSFITNATRERLPYDSHCGASPIVFHANQCDTENVEFVQRGIDLLKQVRKRFVPHVSPYIRNDRNLTEVREIEENEQAEDNCHSLITNYEKLLYRVPPSLEIYEGLVGECRVLYPNYDYASVEFMKGLWIYNGSLDGVVLENSWPLDQTNKTHNETAVYLPYFNQNFEAAFDETPPWNLKLVNNGSMYFQNHNKYGNYFAKAFRVLLDEATPVWSTNQLMNGEVAVNRQNIDASWTNLHQELIEAALGGVSGHWLWSSPVCGDTDNYNPDAHASLCVKWYMASVFFPILKIHSKTTARNPLAFIGTHKQLIVNALNRRLSLLPYLYTTLQDGPLLRPMFYQFPDVDNLTEISTQFSVGRDLLIVPNLQPLQTHVHLWLPPGSWYELWSGLRLEGEVGQPVTMSTTEADFLTAIRGGAILVVQKNTRETADETRLRSAMSLTVALDCMNNGTECQASGRLYITDDMSIIFEATEHTLVITAKGVDISLFCDPNRAILSSNVNEIAVFGLRREFNNNDHYRHLHTSIDLCNLQINNRFPLS